MAEIIEKLRTKEGKFSYMIDSEYSVFSLSGDYEEKVGEGAAVGINSLQVGEQFSDTISKSSEAHSSDEEVEEAGLGSRAMTAISAMHYKIQN